MPKRDCYEVLGVHRNATEAEIKKAYRRLALAHHPDRNPGNAEAEARFKEAAEAYEMLVDPATRARYDQVGHADETGFGAYGGGNFDFRSHVDDLFGEIFGDVFGHRRPRGPRPERGEDLRYNLAVDFQEGVFGADKEIQIPVVRACPSCGGSGAKPGTSPTPCADCHGRGRLRHQQGFFTVERECPRCEGAGTIVANPCTDCDGRGQVERPRSLTLKVPPGVETGSRLRVAGEGTAGRHGGPPGDLYVVLTVKDHPLFSRHGSDIVCEVPVSFVQAALGAEIEAPTLDGVARVQVPPGTQNGSVLTLRGRGGPKGRHGSRGDQKIVISVEVPRRISPRQAELLREFEGLRQADSEPGVAGLWEKAKKIFG